MTSPRILLNTWNIYAKKQFGQNFLSDPSTAEMIVARSRILSGDVVFEIGAGLGALTIPAARIAKKVYAVEKDYRLINILKDELLKSNLVNVVILNKNILEVDIKEIAEKESCKFVVMGNLPYNISSQILVQLIKSRISIKRVVLMFQKELAQRIKADPGCKDYGRLSVMLQYCADIKTMASVKASLFFPKPKVDSEVLEIKFNEVPQYPAKNEAFFFRVIKAAFGKRRKTMKNALAGSELSIDAKTAHHLLENIAVDPSRRAETLSVEEFVKLSNSLNAEDFKIIKS